MSIVFLRPGRVAYMVSYAEIALVGNDVLILGSDSGFLGLLLRDIKAQVKSLAPATPLRVVAWRPPAVCAA